MDKKMYDMTEKDGWGNSVNLKSTKIPEIEDFKIDEEVDLHIVGKVKSLNKRTESEIISPGDNGKEKPKPSEKKKEFIEVELKILKCGIMNVKEDRKKADEMNLDKKDFDEIQAKRKKRQEEKSE